MGILVFVSMNYKFISFHSKLCKLLELYIPLSSIV